MSVIPCWHLANWNGFSLVDVFLNSRIPPSLPPPFKHKETDREIHCYSCVKYTIQNAVYPLSIVLHVCTKADPVCAGCWAADSLNCIFVLGRRLLCSARRPSAPTRASYLTTLILQRGEAKRDRVTSEWPKSCSVIGRMQPDILSKYNPRQ